MKSIPEELDTLKEVFSYNKKWVTDGGSGNHQIGDFDGYTFTPETDKLNYFDGNLSGTAHRSNDQSMALAF